MNNFHKKKRGLKRNKQSRQNKIKDDDTNI